MIGKMSKKALVVTIAILFFGTCIIPISGSIGVEKNTIDPIKGITLYVGGSGAGNHSTIQEAIANSSNGDTVFVFDNSSPYLENININKQISVIGENRDTTIINGVTGQDQVVRITKKTAVISGFTIRGASGGQDGITVVLLIEDTTISNNIIEDCLIGILLQAGSARTEIFDNIITNNEYEGIQLSESDRNDITGNTIEGNGGSGIALETISKQNEITNNTIEDNLAGIKLLGGSSQNIITGNKILNNEREGIFAEGLITTANEITGNNITNNREGMKISRGGKNIINSNNIQDNKMDGVYLTLSNENIIEMNNFIGNRKNARVIISFRNSWDANYWDDWIGLKIPLFENFPKVIKSLFLRSFDNNPQEVPYSI